MKKLELGIACFVVCLLVALPSRATVLYYLCGDGIPCSGSVTQNGMDYTGTGVDIFTTSGPWGASDWFMSFDTASLTMGLQGDGLLSGVYITGAITQWWPFEVVKGNPILSDASFNGTFNFPGEEIAVSSDEITVEGTGVFDEFLGVQTPTSEVSPVALLLTGIVLIFSVQWRRSRK